MAVVKADHFPWPGKYKRSDVLYKYREDGYVQRYIHDGTEWAGLGADIYKPQWLRDELEEENQGYYSEERQKIQDVIDELEELKHTQ